MKKLWWGLFFLALAWVTIALPDSLFSSRVKELFLVLTASLAFALPVLQSFAPGAIQTFINERVKGLAKQQDIEKLTKQFEEIKLQHSRLLENHKTENLLRMAAIDERLSVHQEAYSIWGKLVLWDKVEDEEDRFSHMDLVHWWKDHNLYLEPEAREAFRDMTSGYYQVRGLSDEGITDEEAWEKIWEAGPIIETSIGLPPIDIRRDVLKA